MRIELHRFTDASNLERAFKDYEEDIQHRLGLLARGQGDTRAIFQSILTFSFWNGCILLILGREDSEAVRYFRQALEAGLRSLDAPPGTGGPRVFHALLERSESGTRTLAIHETPPSREPHRLTIVDYDKVLMATGCFGTREELEAVARYPEERYRNPNLTADESYYTFLRGLKKCVLGDEAGARRDGEAALRASKAAASKHHIGGFLSVLARDEKGLLQHLEKALVAHRKRYEKEPGLADGVISQPALLLSRLALERGIVVEDGPYLPTRLLPKAGTPVH